MPKPKSKAAVAVPPDQQIDAILIFDLDYTIWPFWADTHVAGPFRPLPANAHSRYPRTQGVERFLDTAGKSLLDRRNQRLHVYKDVRQILTELREMPNVIVVACSRTDDPPTAKLLLDGFELTHLFDEVFFRYGPKTTTAEDMLDKYQPANGKKSIALFDDEYRNIRDAAEYGIQGVEIDSGRGVYYDKVFGVLNEILGQ